MTTLGQRVSTRACCGNPSGTEEVFEELSSWLAGQPLDQVKRIIGPERPQFPATVDDLAEYSRVPSHRWLGP